MNTRRLKHWLLLALFSVTAITLLLLPSRVKIPMEIQTFSRAIGEALIVAVIVALAVEPRLLRHFGDEIVSQTFWNTFYSRAPRAYKEAIQQLASKDRFADHARWRLAFDWADESKSAIRLTIVYTGYFRNSGPKSQPLRSDAFIYDSPFTNFTTSIHRHQMICTDSAFDTDLIKDGHARMNHGPDGRLLLESDPEAPPYFSLPVGQRYVINTEVVTYAHDSGHFPLAMTVPTLQFTIELEGSALSDLYLSVVNPSSGSYKPIAEGAGEGLAGRGAISVPGVFLTGQAVLLSWKHNKQSGSLLQ